MFNTNNLSFMDTIFYDDIHIEKSKVNFIVGKSGTGKSTLLKLFNKTANYSSGEILYKGKSILDYDSIELRKEVKLISQTTFLFHGTIKENFSAFYNYCENNNLTEDQMKKFLGMVEADFLLERVCDTLSGGERQRVYIAICLSMEAEVVMLDEPTSALDYELATTVLENIIRYVKENEKTLIVISHDNKLTNKFAENIIILNGGGNHE